MPATELKPAWATSAAKETYLWVPVLADPAAATVTELTAASVFDVSGSFFGEQEYATATAEKATLPRRFNALKQTQVTGAETVDAPDLVIGWDPQGDEDSDSRKAWDALAPREAGYLVRLQNHVPGVLPTAGRRYDVATVEVATRTPGRNGSDTSSLFQFTASLSVTDVLWQQTVVA